MTKKNKAKFKQIVCAYCQKNATLVGLNWTCTPCNAIASIDEKSGKLKSSMAKPELRKIRKDAQKACYDLIDLMVICGLTKTQARKKIISTVNKQLNLKIQNFEYGFKDPTTCKRILSVVHNLKTKTTPICPYCKKESVFVASKSVYRCDPCDAQVGVHKSNNAPLGTLANPELRKARMNAHDYFDPLWKYKMKKDATTITQARKSAYRWLSESMGLSVDDCHIAMFDVADCMRVIEICRPYVAKALHNLQHSP